MSPPKLPELPKNRWKPRHHIGIYDYNYKVGESYYHPQTTYIHNRPIEPSPSAHEKPPESQTYAERFAENPIYGSAHGLPYADSQSVFRQPMATHSVGTRSRASSLSRDTGVSKYLSSLGSGDTFNRNDSKLQRHLADTAPHTPAKRETAPTTKTRDPLVYPFRVNSLPPFKKRYGDEEATSFKPNLSYKTRPFSKWQEGDRSSLNDVSRRPRPSDNEYSSRPPLNLRNRRSSLGTPDASLERKAKDELSSLSYGLSSRDEGPRYRSSQYFRDARREQEKEEITKMVDRLRCNSWSGPRPSRSHLRT